MAKPMSSGYHTSNDDSTTTSVNVSEMRHLNRKKRLPNEVVVLFDQS